MRAIAVLLCVLVTAAAGADPPYYDIPAFSEQTPAFRLIPGALADTTELPAQLQVLAEDALTTLRAGLLNRTLLKDPTACFEARLWPTRENYGRYTWALPFWRLDERYNHRFVPFDMPTFDTRQPTAQPVWPRLLDPNDPDDFAEIFVQPVAPSPWYWYTKPLFGDCLWVNAATMEPEEMWLPPRLMAERAAANSTLERRCVLVPQYSRVSNVRSRVFEAKACPGAPGSRVVVSWKDEVQFLPDPTPEVIPAPEVDILWPSDAKQQMRADLQALTGDVLARLPNGKTVNFTRCEADEDDNQLELMAQWFEARYKELNIPVWREPVIWRNKVYYNVVAKLAAPMASPKLDPVILTSHYDTAYMEDLYEATNGTLLYASRGADDPHSGTVTLLLAAKLLLKAPLKRDVLLVHMTGEEYPADCLGARHYLMRQMQEGVKAYATIVLDMIGWRVNDTDAVFQINAGMTPESRSIAMFAQKVTRRVSPGLLPVVHDRWSERSFLYNTDASIWDAFYHPVILLNEHFNYYDNFWRHGYHDTYDRLFHMDMQYLEMTSKAAIHLTARLAAYGGSPPILLSSGESQSSMSSSTAISGAALFLVIWSQI